MKKHNFFFVCFLSLATLTLNGCKDYLTAPEPGASLLSDFFTSRQAAEQVVTGCYVPLMWEYNNTYFCEWFIGDIVSDDALKGGQNTNDMADAYDLENWKTISTNGLLLDYYRAQYQGIGRCNLALQNIATMTTDTVFTPRLQQRFLGEAYFLRAYYYFRLLRVFGGVPLTTKVIDSEDQWKCPRCSEDSLFAQIISDLEMANRCLLLNSQMNDPAVESSLPDLGRATRGAAQAMLLKVYLYMASPYWNARVSADAASCYASAKAWGDSIISSAEYSLCPLYWDNFTLAGENGPESVFEIQYKEVPWGDYGEGYGYTAGSFTQILTRSRNTNIGGGWGFNHPTHNLYDEYEAADPRRDLTILVPTSFQNENEEKYLGSAMLNRKYAMYEESSSVGGGYGQWGLHASRGPLNNKQIRYADVLLMMAEACLHLGETDRAKQYIDQVRERAGLPKVDTNYSFSINGTPCTATADLEQTLRHERRMELAMEGHRWFDLVRWGNTKAHMDAYRDTESEEAKAQMAEFVAGKHELFPIPFDEITLNPMEQNFGY